MTTDSATGCIPLIDFSPFLVDDVTERVQEERRLVAAQLDAVNRQHGFLALTGFGLSAADIQTAFGHAQQLFALPEDVKCRDLTRITPATNTGYAPYQSESLNRKRRAELKEAFNVRFPPSCVNPLAGTPAAFLEPLIEETLLPKYRVLAERYALACAMALQLPEDEWDFFAQHLQAFNLCTVRMLHYPPCEWTTTTTTDESDQADSGMAPLRINEHTDFGLFTFLLVHPDHGPEGLQIKPVEAGGDETAADGWHDVVFPQPSSDDNGNQPVLIVNTGALLARWTNDTWKATAHRVIVPDAAAASRHRYSIACFIDPDHDSMVCVHPSFVQDGDNDAIKYPPIKSSDYLTLKLQTMMKKSDDEEEDEEEGGVKSQ